MKQERVDKINYYLDIAGTVAQISTCRRRIYGAVIVQHDEIVSTGYVGAPRGRTNCLDLDHCIREKLQVPRGERYELCRSVHAEANAIISAKRSEMLGADMFLVGYEADSKELIQHSNSCSMCKRMIINAGISRVIIRDSPAEYRIVDVYRDWVEQDESMDGVFGY